ncbi:TfoX/Sxy family protein [Chryseolinea sp. T2]|uniref:TfoX/Sxy family protein n=1 Tax=Chryseolinea sp. T2 TaxID=3129255 RepID=UPI003077914C
MPYDTDLADRVRLHLAEVPRIKITEKKMFRGLAFLVNGKMCVNVSGDNLMCRIDPERYEIVSKRKGFKPMVMRGKEMKGYCYVSPDGFKAKKDFDYWLQQCLDFNPSAKASKKKRPSVDAMPVKVKSSPPSKVKSTSNKVKSRSSAR